MPDKGLRRIKNIPAAVISAAGLISTLVGLVLLIRENIQIGIVIIGLIAFVYFFLLCAYVIFAKKKSIQGAKGKLRFKKLRPFAMGGIIACLVLLAYLMVSSETRTYVFEAFTGPKAPSPVPAPFANVTIAQFDSKHASRTVEFSKRIEGDLRNAFDKHGLGDLSIRTILDTVHNDTDAGLLLARDSGMAVIWGWYDDFGINVQVTFGRRSATKTPATGLGEIPWTLADKDAGKLSVVVHEVVPENITFLSLCVIGRLAYEGNNYKTGYTALNAAMKNKPKDVRIENEAILHFMNARGMQLARSNNIHKIVCEYATAIALDRSFVEAYNNLGIVFETANITSSSIHGTERQCLLKAGILSSPSGANVPNAEDLFLKALKIRSDFALARYNLLAYHWNRYYPEGLEDFEREALTIEQMDPTIPGTNILLGNFAFDRDSLQEAASHYRVAQSFVGKPALLQFNLGQVYFRLGNLDEATVQYKSVLKADSTYEEALIGLANVSLLQGDPESSLFYLGKIPHKRPYPDEIIHLVHVLRSRIYFDGGQLKRAIAEMKQAIESVPWAGMSGEEGNIAHYLLDLLRTARGNKIEADIQWPNIKLKRFDNISRYPNYPLILAWSDLMRRCVESCDTCTVDLWRLKSECLPKDLHSRISTVFDLIQARIGCRLAYRREIDYSSGG